MPNFTERLRAASEAANSLLCVGLDPDPARIPLPSVTEFNRAIVSATADLVCAFKPNLAFYEALGLPGWNALEKTVRHIRDVAPHSIIIGDGKRGDIDSSAAAYATAMFDVWGFDCVTVNPWGGMDTVEPWLTNPEKGAFIWCRGSNRGAADLQDLAGQRCGQPHPTGLPSLGPTIPATRLSGQPRPRRRRHCPPTVSRSPPHLSGSAPAYPRHRSPGRRFGRLRSLRCGLPRTFGRYQRVAFHHLRLFRRGLRLRCPTRRFQAAGRNQLHPRLNGFGMAVILGRKQ